MAEEAAGFGIWEVDMHAGTMTMSDGMLRLKGLPADAPLRYTLEEFGQISDPEQTRARSRPRPAVGVRAPSAVPD